MKVNIYTKYRGDQLINSIQIGGQIGFICGSNSSEGWGEGKHEQVEFDSGRNGKKITKMTFPALALSDSLR